MTVIDLEQEIKQLKESNRKLLEENEKIITERHKELLEHRKNSTLLRELGGLTKTGAWELDIETKAVYWTEEVKIIHDVEKSYEPTLEKSLNFYTPESRTKLVAALENSMKTGEVFDLEMEIISAKGLKKQVRGIGRIDNEVGMLYGTFQDITEQKLIQDTQLFLINSSFLGDRETFFKSLARFLSKSLDMDFVCIDKLTGDNLSAQTLAMYYLGKFEDNIVYTLKETPCGEVVGKDICYYPKGVKNLFPYDKALQDLNAESYVGTTLWSSDGNPIGLIAVIGKKPLNDYRLVETILSMVSSRAAGELERSEVEIQLKQRQEELEKQISLKDKFFSIIAHDLRSPFHAFLNLTEIMALEGEELKVSEFKNLSKELHGSAKNLFNLLNNLLDWAGLQQGMITFQPERIAFADLIEVDVELMRERAIQKHINLTTDLAKDIIVVADKNMINSIILNLLSNAIKFSNRGGKVEIKSELIEDDILKVIVKDDGIGMPEKMLQNLFKINEKVGRKGTDGERSSGLGLLLCKEFVEKHGGNLWVESQAGEGSTFYFTLKNAKIS
jgi:two-component system CheB/CheR fusion protein